MAIRFLIFNLESFNLTVACDLMLRTMYFSKYFNDKQKLKPIYLNMNRLFVLIEFVDDFNVSNAKLNGYERVTK